MRKKDYPRPRLLAFYSKYVYGYKHATHTRAHTHKLILACQSVSGSEFTPVKSVCSATRPFPIIRVPLLASAGHADQVPASGFVRCYSFFAVLPTLEGV